jgi:hypothetical protein
MRRHNQGLLALVLAVALAACGSAPRAAERIVADQRSASAPHATTGGALKVAFIGDSGNGREFAAVLALIKNENADLVLHQGDFDYALDADGFFAQIDASLGPNFPYLAAVGNHDAASWRTGCGDPDGCYAQLVSERMARAGIVADHPDLDDEMYAVAYRGLKIVFVGQQRFATETIYPRYIHDQLTDDAHIWKICSWHKNQKAMQLGGKHDEMGWAVYETCKNHGAIVATGHEHSYARTKTLTSIAEQTVDLDQHPPVGGVPSNPDRLAVAPGRTFVFVSALAGTGMRQQERCTPATYPYGGGPACNYIWAKAYTSTQLGGEEQFGALFITFNYDGDPAKARGYFKTTAGAIVDEFEIVAQASR